MDETAVGLIAANEAAARAEAGRLSEAGLAVRCLQPGEAPRGLSVLLICAADAPAARAMVPDAGRRGGLGLSVIVLLDQGDSAARAEVLESGADDCLTRPVTVRELAAHLVRLMNSATFAQEAARSSAIVARQMGHAERIQRFILPLKPPPIAGLEIVAEYLPAATLGGDFFDILPFADGRVAFFMSDVAGHGVGAALNAMLLKSQLAVWARPETPVAQTLRLLNGQLFELTDLDYATAVYAVVDPRARRLEFAVAGHPAPLLLRGAQPVRAIEPDEPGTPVEHSHAGLPLGLFTETTYSATRLDLQAGDRIFLFTDGLIEWRDTCDEMLGLDGLCRLLDQSREQSLGDQVSWLLGQLQQRSAGEPQADDVNILAFRMA